jgi:hypothetical protein
MQQLPAVSPYLRNAFLVARAKYQGCHGEWTNLSCLLSGRFCLFNSMISIQRYGDIDLLLRCIEDEFEANKAAEATDTAGVDFTFHYQIMLSENWIVGIYEIFRAFRQRDDEARKLGKLGSDGVSDIPNFKSIFADLELLRIPLAKYEIAKDKKMSQPAVMEPFPPSSGSATKYIYDKDDPNRNHIMPTGISSRGSVMWLAFDHRQSREYWIERRDLADRILSLKGEIVPAGILEARRAAIANGVERPEVE